MSKADAHATAVSYLEKAGIANAEARMKQFPFQLSGGLRQRIMIAMMMSLQPRLLIADEPTTALDVTIQKQVLLLLNRLKQDMKTGILFITHDLGVVAQIADRVIVLYSGSKVEEGATRQIFENPLHPYTNGLIAAVPNVCLLYTSIARCLHTADRSSFIHLHKKKSVFSYCFCFSLDA